MLPNVRWALALICVPLLGLVAACSDSSPENGVGNPNVTVEPSGTPTKVPRESPASVERAVSGAAGNPSMCSIFFRPPPASCTVSVLARAMCNPQRDLDADPRGSTLFGDNTIRPTFTARWLGESERWEATIGCADGKANPLGVVWYYEEDGKLVPTDGRAIVLLALQR